MATWAKQIHLEEFYFILFFSHVFPTISLSRTSTIIRIKKLIITKYETFK